MPTFRFIPVFHYFWSESVHLSLNCITLVLMGTGKRPVWISGGILFNMLYFLLSNALVSWEEDRKPSNTTPPLFSMHQISEELTCKIPVCWSSCTASLAPLPSTLSTVVDWSVPCKENAQRKIKSMECIHLLYVTGDRMPHLPMTGDVSSGGEEKKQSYPAKASLKPVSLMVFTLDSETGPVTSQSLDIKAMKTCFLFAKSAV